MFETHNEKKETTQDQKLIVSETVAKDFDIGSSASIPDSNSTSVKSLKTRSNSSLDTTKDTSVFVVKTAGLSDQINKIMKNFSLKFRKESEEIPQTFLVK